MKLHRRIAGWFGYELIKKRKLNDTLEQHIANVIELENINLVIDVGANIGQYARSLRLHGYAGRIASFEPVSSAFATLLKDSNLDPDWRSYQLALGARNMGVTMQLYAATEFSSLFTANDFARKRFGWRTAIDGQEEVTMSTLSTMWRQIAESIAAPRALLKLDTQGSDLDVLAGAAEILPNIYVIQAELSLKSIYDGAPRYLDALAEFERQGFEVTGLYPISRDKQTLAVVECDCVMTRCRSGELAKSGRGKPQFTHLNTLI